MRTLFSFSMRCLSPVEQRFSGFSTEAWICRQSPSLAPPRMHPSCCRFQAQHTSIRWYQPVQSRHPPPCRCFFATSCSPALPTGAHLHPVWHRPLHHRGRGGPCRGAHSAAREQGAWGMVGCCCNRLQGEVDRGVELTVQHVNKARSRQRRAGLSRVVFPPHHLSPVCISPPLFTAAGDVLAVGSAPHFFHYHPGNASLTLRPAPSLAPSLQLREMSPLWEMVQEGIDLKTIEWAQH